MRELDHLDSQDLGTVGAVSMSAEQSASLILQGNYASGNNGDIVAESEDDEDNEHYNQYGEEDEDDVELGNNLKMTKFIMKNGCCRDCMKAFSKSGKVS